MKEILICVLKINVIILLSFLTICYIYILINITRKIKKQFLGNPCCKINTDISISLDGGKNYSNKIHSVNDCIIKTPVFLKYDITAKAYGFLSYFCDCKVPFDIEMKLSQGIVPLFLEYGGIFKSKPDKYSIGSKTFSFLIWANRKKTSKTTVILKCERPFPSANYYYTFKLLFKPQHIQQYSRTIVLDFKS